MYTKKRIILLFIFLVALASAVFCGGILASAKSSDAAKVVFLYENKKYTYVQNPHTVSYMGEKELYKRGFYLPQTEKAELLYNITEIGFSKEEAVRYVYFGIEDTLKKIEKDINREPVDSKVSFRPDQSPMFSFSAEKDGFLVERAKLFEILFEKLSKNNSATVSVPVTVLKSECTRAFWQQNICERASFSTNYSASSADRKHNVALALKAYNGLTVQAGQKVSFNKLVGARTEARGYRPAKIISGGVYEEGVGGGVCQSSTTLYNAFLIAGLRVTKRSPHSLTSSYVSPGFDAMVNIGSADLEFENNTELPIFIKTTANSSGVTVKIFGAPKEYKIIRRKVIAETVEPPPHKIILDYEGKYSDKVFFSDEWYQEHPSKPGMTVEAYLDYYVDGRLVKSEKLHTDRYKSAQGVFVFGTRLRPPPQEPESMPSENLPQY